MSTKTSLKKIAVIAAMALTLGGFTAISANAAANTATSSVNGNLNVAGGTTVSTTISIGGSVEATAATIGFTYTGGATSTYVTGTPTGGLILTETTSIAVEKTSNNSTTETFVLDISLGGTTGGTVTVTGLTSGSLVFTIGAGPTAGVNNPFVVQAQAGVTADTPATLDTAAESISVKKSVASSTDTVTIKATSNTVAKIGDGNYRYVQVTNSTIKTATSWTLDGVTSVATVAAAPQNGLINGTSIVVNAGTAGQTITVKFWDRQTQPVTGFVTLTLLQTVTIKTAAYSGLNPVTSTAFMWATDAVGAYPTGRGNTPEPATEDDDVLAKSALNGVGGVYSGAGKAVAVIKVSLKDIAGNGLQGTLPSVGASIAGPGTLSMGTASNADASTGRLLLLPAAAANVYYVNVFSDGTSGVATISLWVGGAVWKTKTMSFYGAPTKLVASQNHKVLKAGTTTGATCDNPATVVVEALAATPENCALTTVASSYAVQVAATDANGVQVPGLTYTSVPDAKVVTGSDASSTASPIADSLGATWFDVTTAPDAASGVTGTVSYKTTLADTTVLTSNALTFAIGGAPVSVSIAASGSSEVGAKNSLVFTDKDAAGNAPYDLDVPLALTSNVALVVGSGTNATNGLPTTIAMIGGTGTVNFFNPLVAGDVTISGKAAVVLPLTVTVSVTNSALNAAADAAAEAIDAANAATDAANAAAEAADAATAAAQDAADAVAALSAQVSTLINALRKQLIALTNLVIKIQKKVRA